MLEPPEQCSFSAEVSNAGLPGARMRIGIAW